MQVLGGRNVDPIMDQLNSHLARQEAAERLWEQAIEDERRIDQYEDEVLDRPIDWENSTEVEAYVDWYEELVTADWEAWY